MVAVVQLVRASDCGSECRGFESHLPPQQKQSTFGQSIVKLQKALPLMFISKHGGRSSVG